MAEGGARPLEEELLAMRATQRVGAHDPHAVGAHVAQPLAESLEAGQRTCRDFAIEATVAIDTRPEAHHFAQPVHDEQLPVGVPGDDHVETVRAQIYCGEQFGHRTAGGTSHASGGPLGGTAEGQAVNEEPQPQVVLALGLRITNCAPSSPSR